MAQVIVGPVLGSVKVVLVKDHTLGISGPDALQVESLDADRGNPRYPPSPEDRCHLAQSQSGWTIRNGDSRPLPVD